LLSTDWLEGFDWKKGRRCDSRLRRGLEQLAAPAGAIVAVAMKSKEMNEAWQAPRELPTTSNRRGAWLAGDRPAAIPSASLHRTAVRGFLPATVSIISI